MAAAVTLPLGAIAADADADAVRGNFMGSGRACYGMLTITARAVTWMTPFSQCKTSPYAIREHQSGNGNNFNVVFQLIRPSAKCRYRVLRLSHDGTMNKNIGWNVIAYPSRESAATNRVDAALSCYLYRD